MAGMKPRHVAALALVGWYLMVPLPLRADGPIAVPGTADVETGLWYLMMAPTNDSAPTCNDCEVPFDRTRPLSQWRVYQAFPTKHECLDHPPGNAEDFQLCRHRRYAPQGKTGPNPLVLYDGAVPASFTQRVRLYEERAFFRTGQSRRPSLPSRNASITANA